MTRRLPSIAWSIIAASVWISATGYAGRIWAMPTARARRASHQAMLHCLGHSAPIAIAVASAIYFGAQLLRAVAL